MTPLNLSGDSAGQPVRTVLIGGDAEALSWVPRLYREPQINLVGLVPTHPADLIHHLGRYGYTLTEPGPLTVFADLETLADAEPVELIIDTTTDPGTVRRLADVGLSGVPRINPAGLELMRNFHSEPPGEDIPKPRETGFSERLAREVGRAYRHGRSLGLVLLKVSENGVETVLEDPVLQAASQAVEESLRLEDVVARYGGGTVAVLLPETGESTRTVARRLTSHLAELRIPAVGDDLSRIHASVGWAWFPQDAKTAQALVEQAQARMMPDPPPGA